MSLEILDKFKNLNMYDVIKRVYSNSKNIDYEYSIVSSIASTECSNTVDCIGIYLYLDKFVLNKYTVKSNLFFNLYKTDYYERIKDICSILNLPVKIFIDSNNIPDTITELFKDAIIVQARQIDGISDFIKCKYKFISNSLFSVLAASINQNSTVFYPGDTINDFTKNNWIPILIKEPDIYLDNLRVVVLTTRDSNRLTVGIRDYPDVLPDYDIFYGPRPGDPGIKKPEWYVKPHGMYTTTSSLEGTWCCLLGKLRLFEEHYKLYPDKDLLMLEDDVAFLPNFSTIFINLLKKVPEDWDILWLGGHSKGFPVEIQPDVLRANDGWGSECVLFKSSVVPKVIHELSSVSETYNNTHSDVIVRNMRTKVNMYMPIVQFAGQNSGYSYILSKYRDIGFQTKFSYIDMFGNMCTSTPSLVSKYL